ncbi:MAG: SGNH/GDSL hydrolase family protein [Oscillospiraceae bacterium]|nr:SGNH/GDSL hydrolase family protein [Oscillospiraceae bacterium]
MKNRILSLKNIIWAIGIVLCLIALLVGLIFAVASKYGGEQEDGRLYLGGEPVKSPSQSVEADGGSGGSAALTGTGSLNTLAESADAGQSYIDSLTFLCDSSLLGLRDFGLLTGGAATAQLWASAAGNIPAASLSQCAIVYPGDGSELGAAGAAALAKPAILVISLGMDGLAEVDQMSFTAAYTELLNNIHAASPDTVLVCCSLSSVIDGYSGADGLTAEMAAAANGWLQQVCTDTGVYYADISSVICNGEYSLTNSYASSNGKSLNSAGLSLVLQYLRTHAVS